MVLKNVLIFLKYMMLSHGVVGPKFQNAIQQHASNAKLGAFSIPVEVHWNMRDETPCRFFNLKGVDSEASWRSW